MAQFAYKARKRTGEVVTGVLDVADRPAALVQIERMGLLPVLVDASKGAPGKVVSKSADRSKAAANANASAGVLPPALREYFARQRKPKLQELATYTQQLANLLNSGMPLTVALNSMTHLSSKGINAEVSRQLKQDVMEGKSLSDAMAKQPVVFSDLYINMVRAGEQSGALVDVLRRLADHYVRFSEVQTKFTSALVYPAFVGAVGIGIMFFFMTYMLPKFLSIFQGMKVTLPTSTQILILVSNTFSKYWWVMALTALAAIVIFKRFQSTDEGKKTIDSWKMNAPIIGHAVRLNLFGQFARTLSTLLQNGVPVLTALKITEQIMPNRMVKEAIAQTREAVTDGKTIAQPLARSQLFPQLMIDLLKIGEETGDVPGALKNIADTYENELNIALKVMTNMIEPIMIVLMAIGVGGLLFSVLSAMFAITSTIGQQ
jgi:type II secretory pathway component PulF